MTVSLASDLLRTLQIEDNPTRFRFVGQGRTGCLENDGETYLLRFRSSGIRIGNDKLLAYRNAKGSEKLFGFKLSQGLSAFRLRFPNQGTGICHGRHLDSEIEM
jgi:hypothetical protein